MNARAPVVRVLAMVLAGGEGKRLAPLTADRAKPAVPFGGSYRLIDFALSNLANAGYTQIVVLTQYKSHSLDRHLAQTWRLNPMLGNFVASVPAQMRQGPRWFAGSADAIFQNLNLIYDERPDYICVFGADHIYRMDPRQFVEWHIATGAGLTVAATRVPLADARSFGIIDPKPNNRIGAFREKPERATGLPDSPNEVFASMGNYVFTASTLVDAVTDDAADDSSRHDIGGDIVPKLVASGDAAYYDFATNEVPGALDRDRGYWRDVGDLDAYYDAHMDLISPEPVFNLYNLHWPIHTWHPPLPPAKFVFDDEDRRGHAVDSLVSAGCIISGGTVRRSVLSTSVFVEDGALVEGSILMDAVRVGAGAVVRNAIIDKAVDVPAGAQIGVDPALDRQRFAVSQRGIVVIGKGQKVPPTTA
jgi:glucose-1-phosphate adenylyltransferase